MPSDQPPPAVSDAEVDAILKLWEARPDALTLCKNAARIARQLQRDRQTAEARSAAAETRAMILETLEGARSEVAARMAFDAAWERSGEGWNSECGVSPERYQQMRSEDLAKICQEGPAALATLLTAARAEALWEAIHKAWEINDAGSGGHAGEVAQAIIALLPTLPAGGADDAGSRADL